MALTNCLVSSSGAYTLDCRIPGGANRLLLANWSASTTYSTDSTGTVTGSTLAPTFYTVQLRNETADIKEKSVGTGAAGSIGYETDIIFNLYRSQATLRNFIAVLGQAQLTCIATSVEGTSWLYGQFNGLDLVTSASQLGKSLQDMNGSVITLKGFEKTQAPPISAAFLAGLTIV